MPSYFEFLFLCEQQTIHKKANEKNSKNNRSKVDPKKFICEQNLHFSNDNTAIRGNVFSANGWRKWKMLRMPHQQII